MKDWIDAEPGRRRDAYFRSIKRRIESVRGDLKNIQCRLEPDAFYALLREGYEHTLRAMREERIEWIASVVALGMSGEQAEADEAKFFLQLLDRLNDDQVARLVRMGEDSLHATAELSRPTFTDPSDFARWSVIQRSYNVGLVQAGLAQGLHSRTELGNLFLEYIGLLSR
ncbi:MAG: hypothetical protein KDC95_08305 [Planctomycetes bacterium]|nr:hypothetical protein [Planctomycetota bacterium]